MSPGSELLSVFIGLTTTKFTYGFNHKSALSQKYSNVNLNIYELRNTFVKAPDIVTFTQLSSVFTTL
jgi:hypothetical protein